MTLTFDDGLWAGFLIGLLTGVMLAMLKRSCMGGTIYIANSFVGQVSGGSIRSSFWEGQAAQVKLVAVDNKGEELANYHLDQGVHLDLNIEGVAEEIRSSFGQVKIENCGNINVVRTSQGDVDISKCLDVGVVRTSQGNITIAECQVVNSTKTSQGNISVRSRSQTR